MFESSAKPAPQNLKVFLDGRPVKLPAQRRSLSAIRTYLETLALENERVLCTFSVDGCPTQSPSHREKAWFGRVEGVTVGLNDMPMRMLETALKETAQARAAATTAVTLVLINDGERARELWWELARKLKEPLLTLSLLPETLYQPAAGCASLPQVRKWQLQQLAGIIKAVDEACGSPDPAALSNALEKHAVPWLDKLHQLIGLWLQTVLASARRRSPWDRDIDLRSLAGA